MSDLLLLVSGTEIAAVVSDFPGSGTEPMRGRTGINRNCRKGKRESGPSLPYPRQPNLSCLYVLVCTDIFCHFWCNWMQVIHFTFVYSFHTRHIFINSLERY